VAFKLEHMLSLAEPHWTKRQPHS